MNAFWGFTLFSLWIIVSADPLFTAKEISALRDSMRNPPKNVNSSNGIDSPTLLKESTMETVGRLLKSLKWPSVRDTTPICPDPFGRLIPMYDKVCFSVLYRHQTQPNADIRIINQDYTAITRELSRRPNELKNVAIAITQKCNALYSDKTLQKTGVFILAATYKVPKNETQFLSVSCCLPPFCLKPPESVDVALQLPEFYSQQKELKHSRLSLIDGWHLTFTFDESTNIQWPTVHYLTFSELSVLSYYVCSSLELEFIGGRQITQMLNLVSAESEIEHYENLNCMATQDRESPFFEIADMLRAGSNKDTPNCVGMDIAESCLVAADLLAMEILRGERILQLLNDSKILYSDEFNSIMMTYNGISPIILYYCNYTAIGPFCDNVFYSVDFIEHSNFPGREDFAECGQKAAGLLVLCRLFAKFLNGKMQETRTPLNPANLRLLVGRRYERGQKPLEDCEILLGKNRFNETTRIGFDCLCIPNFVKNTTKGCNGAQEYTTLIRTIYESSLLSEPNRQADNYAYSLRNYAIGSANVAAALLSNTVSTQRHHISRVYVDHQFFPPVPKFVSTLAQTICGIAEMSTSVNNATDSCKCANSRCSHKRRQNECNVCCCRADNFAELLEEEDHRLELMAAKRLLNNGK